MPALSSLLRVSALSSFPGIAARYLAAIWKAGSVMYLLYLSAPILSLIIFWMTLGFPVLMATSDLFSSSSEKRSMLSAIMAENAAPLALAYLVALPFAASRACALCSWVAVGFIADHMPYAAVAWYAMFPIMAVYPDWLAMYGFIPMLSDIVWARPCILA